MAPTIHIVRHAQGYHNLSFENESIHDPDLTPFGEQQCADLRASFPYHDKVTKLIASPFRRTLHTAIRTFGSDALYPIVALDSIQELSDSTCDIGTEVATLKEEFGDKVDLSRVSPGWIDKGPNSPFEPEVTKVTARAKAARLALRELAGKGDDHVVVVTHGAIVHFLTDDWLDMPKTGATAWKNCECRSYQFVDQTDLDEDAAMLETVESWKSRTKETGAMPSLTERQSGRLDAQQRMTPYLKVKA